MYDGETFYERHRDECLSYDIPVPQWSSLTTVAKRGWEAAADDYNQKLLADAKDEA